ncbi:hypothetical protein M0R45_017841 [Rubus argutus]|uniref:Uncharacterized protein n=1 Tax=Rubus argutus TaxID=59490 RepID=A0AAW1XXB9_RUBAR
MHTSLWCSLITHLPSLFFNLRGLSSLFISFQSSFSFEMASISICKALFLMVLAMVLVSAVTAQDTAVAPSPSPDAGAGIPVTFSGALVCSSLFISLLALLWH